MKKLIFIFLSLFVLAGVNSKVLADHHEGHATETVSEDSSHAEGEGHEAHGEGEEAHAGGEEHGHGHLPAGWAVIPFVMLLLMIATGPLFFEHFWHKNYPIVAVVLGGLLIGYYVFGLGDGDTVIHTLAEYTQFIALLAGLFMASGGIMINVDKKGTPMANVMLLLVGALLANLMGTTGASMLLIRPFVRLNQHRIKPYHVIFFIFMVSNVGGSLTPIGDPPLFLGFLKGVPFAWTLTHNVVPWIFCLLCLAIVFYFFDRKNKAGDNVENESYSGKIKIKGGKNFLWLAAVIGAVFIDPNVFDWVPSIPANLHGTEFKISFVREVIMLSVACLSYYFADEEVLKGNEFEFEPIKEVAFLFIGIFFTMMPALQLVGNFAKSDSGKSMISVNSLYWGTGALSGVLDNAPTYVNFLTAAVSKEGGNVDNKNHVKAYAGMDDNQELTNFKAEINPKTSKHDNIVSLIAISVASVFFGAMTYIGNAPNFMVKSIAEQVGIKMPSFMAYIVKYSLPILLPILILVWVVFFYFDLVYYIVPH